MDLSAVRMMLSENPGVAAATALVVAFTLYVILSPAPPAGGKQAAQLRKAKGLLVDMIRTNSCHPIMVRCAWHDSGTYDQKHKSLPWPAAGGAIGSIRFKKEIEAGPNAGLSKALKLLDPIKQQCPDVSWADLIQMASATAIELAGGPKIDMIYGRLDADASPDQSVEPFGLPAAFPDEPPEQHLKQVFGKYDGMGDKEIVALSGAHTLGRAFKVRCGRLPRPGPALTVRACAGGAQERSGAVDNGYGESGATKYTCADHCAGLPGTKNGMAGGKSWTKKWLCFDNEYFKIPGKDDPELLALPTDRVLQTYAGFKQYCDKYASDQNAFFADYAAAHKKLSELGSKFEPPEGIRI